MPDGEKKLADFLRHLHRRYIRGVYTPEDALQYLLQRQELWLWAPELDCDAAAERILRVTEHIECADDRMKRMVMVTQLVALTGRFSASGPLVEQIESALTSAAEGNDMEFVEAIWNTLDLSTLLSDRVLDLLASRSDISDDSGGSLLGVATWTAKERLRRFVQDDRHAEVETLLDTAQAGPLEELLATATEAIADAHGLDDPRWWAILDARLNRPSWEFWYSVEALICVASFCAAAGIDQSKRARDLLDLIDPHEVLANRLDRYLEYGAVLLWALGRVDRAREWAQALIDYHRSHYGQVLGPASEVGWIIAQNEPDPVKRLAILLHQEHGRPPGVLGARWDLDVATAYLSLNEPQEAEKYIRQAMHRRTEPAIDPKRRYINLRHPQNVSNDGWSAIAIQDDEIDVAIRHLKSLGIDLDLQ